MYSTGQENSCSFFLVEENLVKTQRCTVCLLASDYLLFLTPFSSNKKIRENEVANSQSRRLCSAPTSMTVLKRLRPFGSSLWHYLSVQKEIRKGKRSLHIRPRLLDLLVLLSFCSFAICCRCWIVQSAAWPRRGFTSNFWLLKLLGSWNMYIFSLSFREFLLVLNST